jgi:hypothetical protein
VNGRGLYVPLAVGAPEDPKILQAGDRAELVFYRALCFAKRAEADGFIATVQAPLIRGATPKVIRQLVDVGLWHEDAGGWQIVAWGRHNDLQSEIDRKREMARARQARHRGGDTDA